MPEDDRKIATARKNWEERKLDPSLKRGPERKKNFVTSSGIEIKRAYDPDDLNGADFVNEVGFPGEYPFTRGVQPTMYRGRLWTMRQYAGFGSAEESNRRYRYLFEQGQTGLSVAFDLPTQMGRDSDHPLAQGEVGRVGVPICSLADMETLLAELPLDKISTSMTINATASILLALYLVVAERRGSVVQVRTVLLIALLAIVRKLLILDLASTDAALHARLLAFRAKQTETARAMSAELPLPAGH